MTTTSKLMRQKWTFLFDVDGTLMGDNGVSSRLLPLLNELNQQGHSLGLCSSQGPGEVTDFVVKKLFADLGSDGLFNAGYILEDGHVWVPPQGIPEQDAQILTSPEALAEMGVFKDAFQAKWSRAVELALDAHGWGFVDGIPYPLVQLAPEKYQGIGSLSIWEKGPEINSPAYQGEYQAVMDWAQALALKLGLRNVELTEAGNGTLRVLQIGLNKGTAMTRLGFDLSNVAFVGNGLNDLLAARVVKGGGGLVMAVGNAIPELKELAHHVTTLPESIGVVELIERIAMKTGGPRVDHLVSPDDIAQAKKVDDEAFGAHEGISVEELERISNQGGLLGVRDEKGRVIGHVQIIFEPIGSQPTHLASDEAYCYGMAIHPSFQGQGIGKFLARVQEELAIQRRRSRLLLSVRLENKRAMALWFRLNFLAYAYDPHYYGNDDDKDGRLLMKKELTVLGLEEVILDLADIPELLTLVEVEDAIKRRLPVFAIGIRSGDSPDRDARELIQLVIDGGYYGIRCTESKILKQTHHAVVFKNNA